MFSYGLKTQRLISKISFQISQSRWASTLSAVKPRDRFSILTKGPVTKENVLKSIASRKPPTDPSNDLPSPPPNSTAILVSKDLSPWLDDSDFISTLLQHLHPIDTNSPNPEDLSLLTAAVDTLCPSSIHGHPSSGLSILQGDTTILPGLWDQPDTQTPTSLFNLRANDARPSISIRLNPFLGDSRPVDVTLPLANTVFQNARPFTLLASRWRRDSSSAAAPRLVDALERETQRIVASIPSIQAHANVSLPLFPLTAPRRIAAGLGNIVRQVDVDGAPVPASEELEVAMHALIDARARVTPEAGPTSNRTWALILPERAAGSLDFVRGLSVAVNDAAVLSEHERAETFARHFSKILAQGGRLHRVLSGGGGWGMKRGLLSLDPQTTYSSPGSQDLESFIAAFGGESTADNVVTPGSYIQFLVEPVAPTSNTNETAERLPSVLLGTTPSYMGEAEICSRIPLTSASVDLVEGHFGALSASGMYINLNATAKACEEPAPTFTKVDGPNSYVWEGSSKWL